MDETDFADMVEHTPVTSVLVEYREPTAEGLPGRLVGACLTDRQGDGYSMIYSFYDPEHDSRSGLGNYIILDHIRRAAEAGLPYVYLGYWVEGSARMQYKVRYRPLDRLTPDGWERLTGAEQDRLIASAAAASRAPRDSARRLGQGRRSGRAGAVPRRRRADAGLAPPDRVKPGFGRTDPFIEFGLGARHSRRPCASWPASRRRSRAKQRARRFPSGPLRWCSA